MQDKVISKDTAVGFRRYSKDARRHQFIPLVGAGLLMLIFGLGLIGIPLSFCQAPMSGSYWVVSICFIPLFGPTLSLLLNNWTVAFSAEGVVIGGNEVYPWDRLSGVERSPVKVWPARELQEKLLIYFESEIWPPTPKVRALIRSKKQHLGSKSNRIFECINTPEEIDRIIAVMRECSSKEIRVTLVQSED